ncbi:hypothetical protein [Atlantibacter hermannii]|uniref:hypothetical protein n=1 Tax=Atlantibacter hermannii TaxID=565 RepID=UPI0028A110F1|nr:hypothetical protein [Atlantibacter hermannii]
MNCKGLTHYSEEKTGENMPSILVFIGDKPPRRLEINEFRTGISYLYPDNVAREIPVKVIFGTFLDGKTSAVLVAADRQVTRDEIARAHRQLIAWPDLAKAG